MSPQQPQPQPPPPRHSATVIEFDRVADGTVVDTHYNGVVFGSVTDTRPIPRPPHTGPTALGHVFARFSPSAESPPNVVSVIAPSFPPAFDIRSGAIQATFTSPQQYVSIDAKPIWSSDATSNPVNKPYLQAFGQDGRIMYTAVYSDQTFLSWQSLIVSSPAPDIYTVVFSCQHQDTASVYGLFDRLVFSDRLPLILPVIAE